MILTGMCGSIFPEKKRGLKKPIEQRQKRREEAVREGCHRGRFFKGSEWEPQYHRI